MIRRKDRYQLRFKFRFCTKCGHVRASNPLSAHAAERFYGTSDYRSMYFPGESAREVLIRKTPKSQTVSPLLRYVQGLGVAPGKIVEWGCGGGWNLIPFRDAGWTVSGFDYDKLYVALGREVLGLPLQEIQTAATQLQSFNSDVVLLNHVLEHAVDPVSLLVRLRKFCTPSTTLVIGVPLLETISIWHWRNFFHIAHIHYFSSDSLVAVARNAGFDVVDCDIKSGLFAMRLADTKATQWPGRRAALRSATAILKGFVEPGFRLRLLFRSVVRVLGLLPIARRLKVMLGQ